MSSVDRRIIGDARSALSIGDMLVLVQRAGKKETRTVVCVVRKTNDSVHVRKPGLGFPIGDYILVHDRMKNRWLEPVQ